ncbi:hypothetical protein JG688_00017610 [Phytophthora aleatoria]|uniref:Uncharacterized protein n=1 Tax=Phytophthora aleatoria TaxID=2496075 RepID=A0A8J5IC72_9STRA|nr:hypothetical protein JG688_00017610 [Phytophthora aleatoria]
MLYILNNRVFPKWFYSYDSSVTRTQREMTHHLVAYVFQVLPGHVPMTQQNQQQVSERNNVNPGCLLPAIDTSTADNMQAASSEILSASWKVHEHQQQHLQQQQWLQQQRFQQRLQIEQETRQRQQPGRLQSTQTRPAIAAPFARSLNMQRFVTMEVTTRLLPPISRPRAKLRETWTSGSGKWKRPLLVSVRRGSNY